MAALVCRSHKCYAFSTLTSVVKFFTNLPKFDVKLSYILLKYVKGKLWIRSGPDYHSELIPWFLVPEIN